MKRLLKGNHAIVEGALQGGCRFFFGYPITPQSELAEWMAKRMPEEKGTFLQAESEVGAINMVLGAAAGGARVMTASSGPGMDLKQEGIANLVAHQLPCVIADIVRGGPGNGALHPGQQDYTQAIRGGRGDLKALTLAPWNVQEMYDLGRLSFSLADTYRNPVIILSDSVLGQVFESLQMDSSVDSPPQKDWILDGAKDRPRRISIAHFPENETYNRFHRGLLEKYGKMIQEEQRYRAYEVEDAELIIISYGIVSRNAYGAVRLLREKGYRVGLFRPITLFPFPVDFLKELDLPGKKLLVVEMSAGQMTADIQRFCSQASIALMPGQATAEVPSLKEIYQWSRCYLSGDLPVEAFRLVI